MLEFNYRHAGEERPPRHLGDGLSFLVRYAAPGVVRPSRAPCEKHCATRSAVEAAIDGQRSRPEAEAIPA